MGRGWLSDPPPPEEGSPSSLPALGDVPHELCAALRPCAPLCQALGASLGTRLSSSTLR